VLPLSALTSKDGTPQVWLVDTASQTVKPVVVRTDGLLDDAVLFRAREALARPFLRDVPRNEQDAEIAGRYHGRPEFARLIADHIAGMTDRYAREAWDALVPAGSDD